MWDLIVQIVQVFTQILTVVTQLVTTIIAGFGAWIAYQTLLRTPVQEPEPVGPVTTEEDSLVRPTLKVFETSNQTTILKITSKGLECHLYDKRKGRPDGRQWILPKKSIKGILSTNNIKVDRGYKLNSGLFSIGPRRNWLYSKKLFPLPEDLEFAIRRMLEELIK